MKRGQVTVYIILGLIIVSIIGISAFLVFQLSNRQTEVQEEVVQNVELINIRNQIKNCISSQTEEAIIFLASHGGYLATPNPATSGGLPYYLYNGKSYMPKQTEVEKRIESYLNTMISECYQSKKNISTDVKLSDKYAEVITKWSIDYQGETISTFSTKTETRFKELLDVTSRFVEENKDSKTLCLDCLSIFKENNFEVGLVSSEDSIIFTVSDSKDENLKLYFGVKLES